MVFSDKKKAESGGEGSDLRTESVQYLGISFAEKDWNGDSIDDPETGLERIEKFYRGRDNEPHVREIYAKLGDIYFDETEYFHAIEVYKRALAKWPYDPDNPKLQDRIVMAFERQRDFGNALKERDELARNYTRAPSGTSTTATTKQAIDTANELAELALVSAAVNHHKAAQDLKKMAAAQKRPDRASCSRTIQKEYEQAAEAYEKYLEQYPNSKNTYEYSYSYAETLYLLGPIPRRGDAQYEKVRDSQARQQVRRGRGVQRGQVVREVARDADAEGRVHRAAAARRRQDADAGHADADPRAGAARLQQAYDVFVQRVPSSGRVPTMTLQGGRDPAALPALGRRAAAHGADRSASTARTTSAPTRATRSSSPTRSRRTSTRSRSGPTSCKAANCGSTRDGAEERGRARQAVARREVPEGRCSCSPTRSTKRRRSSTSRSSTRDPNERGRRQGAQQRRGRLRERQALRARRRSSYERIVNEYPNSKFVDDALFRTAVSYQKAFEFDKAVVSLPAARRGQALRQLDASHRRALQRRHHPRERSELRARRPTSSRGTRPTERQARGRARRYFRAGAHLREDEGLRTRPTSTFNEYVKTYGANDPKGRSACSRRDFRIAAELRGEHDRRAADALYKKIVSQGASACAGERAGRVSGARGVHPRPRRSCRPSRRRRSRAAASSWSASIQAFKTERRRHGRRVQQGASPSSRATWTLAAYFRTGYLYETFSKALLDAPCPPEVKRLGAGACDIYAQSDRTGGGGR